MLLPARTGLLQLWNRNQCGGYGGCTRGVGVGTHFIEPIEIWWGSTEPGPVISPNAYSIFRPSFPGSKKRILIHPISLRVIMQDIIYTKQSVVSSYKVVFYFPWLNHRHYFCLGWRITCSGRFLRALVGTRHDLRSTASIDFKSILVRTTLYERK